MTLRGVIAIDGPSGSGKSSVSKAIARELGMRYLDTGAMYRAVAYGAALEGIDVEDTAAVERFSREMDLPMPTDPDDQRIVVNGTDVTDAIRTSAVSLIVSAVATNLGVRRELVRRQQQIIAGGEIVLEGRDTTTVVAPDAEVRILITAHPEARVARRTAELHDEVTSATMSQTVTEIVDRDAKDATVTNFHTAADGVVTLDTSHLDLAGSIDAVLQIIADSDREQAP
ncbi:(d)CMP kinase [Cumulibacter manganitolerans]|uniref:(d)CMP kinase n=1 Tax=Cumulibacter manganitolerans TaxID=1884992 RepID=UPI001295741C|nr:(d)CMP kinase [Cumulibacter manganitolerans]